MSSDQHSPRPFGLHSREPRGEDRGGHIIFDRFGDSVAALAWETGDHSADEQLANARLFVASPDLLANAAAILTVRPRNWRSNPATEALWLALEASVAKAERGE